MPPEQRSAEVITSQIPTSELKRILTEDFAQQVGTSAWQRIQSTLFKFGLPGVVLVGGFLVGFVDNLITGRVDRAVKEASERIERTARDESRALATRLTEDVRERATAIDRVLPDRIALATTAAFHTQRGEAIQRELQRAVAEAVREFLKSDEFKTILGSEASAAWTRQSTALQTAFIERVIGDPEFGRRFAAEVTRSLQSSDAIPGIIRGALMASSGSREIDDIGQVGALGLLALLDQPAANGGAQRLLQAARTREARQVALRSLGAVSFAGVTVTDEAASAFLLDALRAWQAYCEREQCTAGDPAAAALESFLRRGRDMPEQRGRAAWIATLRRWHEEMIADVGQPGRGASLGLAPVALRQIGSPEATAVLRAWAASTSPGLALTAAPALAGLGAEQFPDAERHTLFRSVWARLGAGASRFAALEQAAQIAMRTVSGGNPNAEGGLYEPELAVLRAYIRDRDDATELVEWMASSRDNAQPRAATPADSCTTARGDGAAPLHRDLCTLMLLLRPQGGTAEWAALREPMIRREGVALLGLLWATAAARLEDQSALLPAARFAPLADLLGAEANPPMSRLAAMLILRNAPDRTAWSALEALSTDNADPVPFLAVTRWLFRQNLEDRAWVAGRLSGYSPELRADLLRMLVSAGGLTEDQIATSGRARPPFVLALRRNPAATLFALRLAEEADTDLTVNLLERDNGLQALTQILERFGRDRQRSRGLDYDASVQLRDRLINATRWPDAAASLPPIGTLAALPVSLAPQTMERYGRVRLPREGLVALGPQTPPGSFVTFYHPDTHRTRVLRPGEPWRVRVQGGGDWLYRLSAPAPLELVEPQVSTASPVGVGERDRAMAIERSRLYRIETLPTDGSGRNSGWLRIANLTPGERLQIATYDLAPNVDTVVSLYRGDRMLALDDDGGDNFESRLTWTADRAGSVMLRLQNIARPGAFSLIVTREE